MKTRILAAITAVVSTAASFADPMGTAFTYQGKLTDGGTLPTGVYDFRVTLYPAASGGSPVPVSFPAINPSLLPSVGVTNGLFTLKLDYGVNVFQGDARWLNLEVRTNSNVADFSALTPRPELTPTPYSIYAATAGTATTAGTVVSGAVGSGGIADGSIAPVDLSPLLLNNTFWRLDGNAGTTPGINSLGTTDNTALELQVNHQRALRIEPRATSPNLVGGHSANGVAPGWFGSTVGGGGAAGSQNWIDGAYATIGGGVGNTNTAHYTTIGGGIANVAAGQDGTVAGGSGNAVWAGQSTVGGGIGNHVNASEATITGGSRNWIGPAAARATIGGGYWNTNFASQATISGGAINMTFGDNSVIAGGHHNLAESDSGVIGGGQQNEVRGASATIAGGSRNYANDDYSAIGGGAGNWATRLAATVAGGNENKSLAIYSAVGGGAFNAATNDNSTVGGGQLNHAYGLSSTVAGGFANNATGQDSSAGGGSYNTVQGDFSIIAGGRENYLGTNIVDAGFGIVTNFANYSVVSGGRLNRAVSSDSGVGSGYLNQAAGDYSVIGGGQQNVVGILTSLSGASTHGVIGGGEQNLNRGSHGTISGGGFNYISDAANYATVLGGKGNSVAGNYSVALGTDAVASQALGLVQGAGRFAAAGDAQAGQYLLRGTTTTATPTTLGGSLLAIPQWAGWAFDILVTARGFNDYTAGYQIKGMIKNYNGTTSFVGVPTVTTLGETHAALDVQVTADDTTDRLLIKVTGVAGETIWWVANVRTVEVTH